MVRRGNRHRYYASTALLRGAEGEAGTRSRVSAEAIEPLVTDHVGQQRSPEKREANDSGVWSEEIRTLVRDHIEKVIVGRAEVTIIGKRDAESENDAANAVTLPLLPPPPKARREILVSGGDD